jgi:hypothetical protein
MVQGDGIVHYLLSQTHVFLTKLADHIWQTAEWKGVDIRRNGSTTGRTVGVVWIHSTAVGYLDILNLKVP